MISQRHMIPRSSMILSNHMILSSWYDSRQMDGYPAGWLSNSRMAIRSGLAIAAWRSAGAYQPYRKIVAITRRTGFMNPTLSIVALFFIFNRRLSPLSQLDSKRIGQRNTVSTRQS